jgi:hypothetical protein
MEETRDRQEAKRECSLKKRDTEASQRERRQLRFSSDNAGIEE